MRNTSTPVLAIFLAALCIAADQPVIAPIPQDLAKIEKRRQDWLDWNRRTLVDAYEKVGNRDPKWDAKAREALELAARMFSRCVDPTVNYADIHKAAKEAIESGCDDPLVVYLRDRSAVGEDYPGDEEAIRRMKVDGKALGESKYPAYRRLVALQLAATYTLSEKDARDATKKEARAFLDKGLSIFPELANADELTEFCQERLLETIGGVIKDYRTTGMDAVAAYTRVDEALGKVPELKGLRLQCRGNFWLQYGWEARTRAFAPDVPKGGFEKLAERLAVAVKAFEEAWEIQPYSRTAQALLDIDRGSTGNRQTMELWFERAMKSNGDNRDACWSKLEWLSPKWYGTSEELLAFGRQCRETKNWRAGITLFAADAHFRHSATLRDGMRDYLGTQEVWAEISSVYDEYLKHYPDDHAARSKFATFAYLARKFPVAEAEFERLGDNLSVWNEVPNYPLTHLKAFRDSIANEKGRKEAP